MKKRWKVFSVLDDKSEIIDVLLSKRGIVSKKEKSAFLNPPKVKEYVSKLSGDFKASLELARQIILKAIKEENSIIIYGDYDADGVCATAILYKVIKNELGYERCSYFIPNRFDHGYGLSIKSINECLEKFSKEGTKVLFITVDTGITATDDVFYIKSLKHRIIITDHHQKSSKIPQADCIVWNDSVVGSTIAWYLSKELGSNDPHSLALACIATITDVQPILGFNRSLVREGLEILNSNPPLGIRKLMDVSGKKAKLAPRMAKGEITTYDLGWIIGPRLNAGGRLIDAYDSLNLFLKEDEAELERIAKKLNDINIERQEKTIEMLEMADVVESKIIISSHPDYHEGIIGLVAAKLTQKYYRPSVVISLGDGYAKGSVRSIPGIDIIDILRKFDNLFINLGGHPMAAGFTIEKNKLNALASVLNDYMNNNMSEDIFVPILSIDAEIPLTFADSAFLSDINKLKPFGMGNNEPLFLSRNVGIASLNTVGKENQHLSLRLESNNKFYKGIFFNEGNRISSLKLGQYVSIVFSIKENNFNGRTSIDLIIKDLVY